LAEPADRETLRAALTLRERQWRDVLRSKHVAQARLVLQHLFDLPFRVWSVHDAPPHIQRMAVERGYVRCSAKTRNNGLLAGLVQSVASPPGIDAWQTAIERWISAG
jgi:hypothetical protein